MKINNIRKSIMLEDKFMMWNRLNKKIVVTKDVIVPGAYLKDPIPKQVTNK